MMSGTGKYRQRVYIIATVVCAFLALVGCEENRNDRDTVERYSTSAGVTHLSVDINRLKKWKQVAEQPLVRLGSIWEQDEFQFGDIGNASFVSDTTVVVADVDRETVITATLSGTPIAQFGGKGQAPGQFIDLGRVDVSGQKSDRIVAFDRQRKRLTSFNVSGELLSGHSVRWDQGLLPSILHLKGVVGKLGNSQRYIFLVPDIYTPASQEGLQRDTVTVVEYQKGPGRVDTLGEFPSQATYVQTWSRGVSVDGQPFSGKLRIGVEDSIVAIGGPQRITVGIYNYDGDRIALLRAEGDRRSVGEEEVSQYIEHRLAGVSDTSVRGKWRKELRRIPIAESMPQLGPIVVTQAGTIWIGQYEPPYYSGRQKWIVLNSTFRVLGTVELLANFRPLDQIQDKVMGVVTDSLGVEYLAVYRLCEP